MPIIILQALKYWKLIGVGLLIAALGFQTVRYERQKAATARSETVMAQQVSEYREAYNRAVAAALAAKEAREKEYENARTKSAEAYANLSGKYRSAVMQRAAKTNPRGAGQPDLPGNTESTGLSPEETRPAGFYITLDDALKTADLAAYAMGAWEWAAGLQEAPVYAIP